MGYKVIPDNYDSVNSKMRNIIETIIFDGIYLLILYKLNFSIKTSLYIALGMIPITVISLAGIEGQSLTQAIINYIRFAKNKRVLTTPSQEYIRERNKSNLLKNNEKEK